jgi:hypothetical protein
MEDPSMRRVCVLLAVLCGLCVSSRPADAQIKVKVGALKLTSSAPLFVGVEKGFFKEFESSRSSRSSRRPRPSRQRSRLGRSTSAPPA